jgi:hypothetical protein
MSPVNEEPPEPQTPRFDRLVVRSRGAMGASDRMPVRVLFLFILTICTIALAPVPANIFGVAAVVLLALDTAMHRR